jgi:hypothetical protein
MNPWKSEKFNFLNNEYCEIFYHDKGNASTPEKAMWGSVRRCKGLRKPFA